MKHSKEIKLFNFAADLKLWLRWINKKVKAHESQKNN